MPWYVHRFDSDSGQSKLVDGYGDRPCKARDDAWNRMHAWLAGEGLNASGWKLMMQTLPMFLESTT
jgi:hypothetical protein